MKDAGIVISLVINLVICFGLPIGYLIYSIRRKRGVKAFLIGAVVFFISQMLLRIPLLRYVLPNMGWYLKMSTLTPLIASIFIGLSAGLFEEIGRYIGFKLGLKKQRTWEDGIAFGLGHGGIEAMLITGVANINLLILFIAYSSGKLEAMGLGSQVDSIRTLFSNLTTMGVLAAGLERIGAVILHIGMTLIVLYGINKRKGVYLLLAILIHGFVDSSIGVVQVLKLNPIVFQGVFLGTIICLLFYIIISKKSFKEMYCDEKVI